MSRPKLYGSALLNNQHHFTVYQMFISLLALWFLQITSPKDVIYTFNQTVNAQFYWISLKWQNKMILFTTTVVSFVLRRRTDADFPEPDDLQVTNNNSTKLFPTASSFSLCPHRTQINIFTPFINLPPFRAHECWLCGYSAPRGLRHKHGDKQTRACERGLSMQTAI